MTNFQKETANDYKRALRIIKMLQLYFNSTHHNTGIDYNEAECKLFEDVLFYVRYSYDTVEVIYTETEDMNIMLNIHDYFLDALSKLQLKASATEARQLEDIKKELLCFEVFNRLVFDKSFCIN